MDILTLGLRISRCENLPVVSQVVSQVLKMADADDASPRQLEQLIERDAALTAKILRVANSPFYGLSQVPSISRAIGVLGMNAIKSLVTSVAYNQIMSGRTLSTKFNKVDFWRHTLAVAVAARILAKIKIPGKADELYAAAMMHDVGLQVMDKFCPVDLDQSIILCQKERIPQVTAERYAMEFDHCMVGGLLADKWALPKVMKHAMLYHHDPFSDPECSATTVYISAACILAYETGYLNHCDAPPVEDPDECFEVIGIAREQLDAVKEVLAVEILKAEQSFKM